EATILPSSVKGGANPRQLLGPVPLHRGALSTSLQRVGEILKQNRRLIIQKRSAHVLEVSRHVIGDFYKHRLEIGAAAQVPLIRDPTPTALTEPVSDETVPDQHAVAIGPGLFHP